jgi:hypothetical protein
MSFSEAIGWFPDDNRHAVELFYAKTLDPISMKTLKPSPTGFQYFKKGPYGRG